MKITKIKIKSDFAHFKIPYSTKIQGTYPIPPISTTIGIIKNLYGEDVSDFVFGFAFESEENIFKDIQRIYKEVNFNAGKIATCAERFVTDISEIHYLVNPVLIIYTTINNELKINECLNMGKTDCLAKIIEHKKIELVDKIGQGYNQWTDINIGQGEIKRIATETIYNGNKGYYDPYTKPLRLNESFEYDKFYDEEEQQNIYLWKYMKDGDIQCYLGE